MGNGRRFRRLARFGWSIETSEGDVRAFKRDDGTVLPVVDRLMGTREAARFLGVRPPNFVRDWASRPDFPSPLATLASGRVWLASDIEQYAAGRRAPKPSDERIAQIARRIVWWQEPAQTIVRPLEFVARVMATGSLDEVRDVERHFGRAVLREAAIKAPPGVFDRRSWNYWLLVLGLERTMPFPVRQVP
ncbi:MAG: helix-turn-helix transcriptional regulator [Candidatus Limnocylindrales bacterium]